jgi:hypothetical protein
MANCRLRQSYQSAARTVPRAIDLGIMEELVDRRSSECQNID